jgi:uncharacterized protein YuzE
MKVTYDPAADTAMIYLVYPLQPGSVQRTEAADVDLDHAAVMLDFDADSRLVALEILGASKVLPAALLTS